jgi:hypothetical protein
MSTAFATGKACDCFRYLKKQLDELVDGGDANNITDVETISQHVLALHEWHSLNKKQTK